MNCVMKLTPCKVAIEYDALVHIGSRIEGLGCLNPQFTLS